jgi:hypothetical protein
MRNKIDCGLAQYLFSHGPRSTVLLEVERRLETAQTKTAVAWPHRHNAHGRVASSGPGRLTCQDSKGRI